MSNSRPTPQTIELIKCQASAWVIRLSSGEATDEDLEQARAWRRRSPAHEQAFQRAQILWLGMDAVRDRLAPPAQTSSKPGSSTRFRHRNAWRAMSALAAVVCLILVLPLLQQELREGLADYRTGVGEQALFTLADGSVIHLNTDTALSVRYSDRRRLIELIAGEMALIAASDQRRPLMVRAAGGETRAIGTEFVVHDNGEGATVALLEGAVEVHSERPPAPEKNSVILEPGQQVRYDRHAGLGAVKEVDRDAVTAWREGRLIFDSVPLAAVIAEIERYRPGRILVLDGDLADHRISGVFDTDKLDKALQVVAASAGARTTRLTDFLILLH